MLKGKPSLSRRQWGRVPHKGVQALGLGDSNEARAWGVCVWRGAGTVAFGAREGSRGWVMEDCVYHARELGFYSEGKGSVLTELGLHFIFTIF